MSWLEALLLGLIQGITEFFPVSSSAHLKLAKMLLGSRDQCLLFDLFCHLGTLIAVLIFLKQEIRDLLQDRKKLAVLLIAMIPLIPAYFLLKPLRDFASQPQYLGLCLMMTGGILFFGYRYRMRREACQSMKRQISDALWIGTMQSAALIPGISRSASTISCARILGWDPAIAVRFSFLLSIPTVIGGNCLELLKMALSTVPEQEVALSFCLAGFLTSCAAGLLIIRFAISLLERGKLQPFAWYCLTMGAITTYFLSF